MRRIERTNQFKRDFKREVKGRGRTILERDLVPVLQTLACDESLDPRHRDHPLIGNWNDHRDCHIRPDLVLLYRKPDEDVLQLVRLGSHAKLAL